MGTPLPISELPAAVSVTETDMWAIVQGGVTKRTVSSQLGAFIRAMFTAAPASLAEGGTGAANAVAARASLGIVAASAVPLSDTTGGAVGTSLSYAREDHAHPIFVLPVGAPNSRSLSLATAYQATNTAKPASVTINLTSTASISLSGGTTNTADIVIGATNGVAGGTGTAIGKYANSNTGALTIGLNLSTVAANPTTFVLPAGWFFAVRTTAGTVSITSAFDCAIG